MDYEDIDFEYASGKDFFDLVETDPALVVVDMQKGFVEEGAIFECPGAVEIIPAVNRLVEVARETEVPVVWVQWEATYPIGGLALKKYPQLKTTRAFWRDSREFELYGGDLTPPDASDYRIVKHTFGAFSQSDLAYMLQNLGVNAVIVTGVATDVCCEATVVGAFEQGYFPVIVSDANAGTSARGHEAALMKMEANYARVMSTAEVESDLRERAQRRRGNFRMLVKKPTSLY